MQIVDGGGRLRWTSLKLPQMRGGYGEHIECRTHLTPCSQGRKILNPAQHQLESIAASRYFLDFGKHVGRRRVMVGSKASLER